MENISSYISEKLVINKDIKSKHYNYHPKTKDELKELVDKLIRDRGNNADLNDIDTSEITNMSNLFNCSDFDGDISLWNVSNVGNMRGMFYDSRFTGKNGDISKWDVSNVKDMINMFNSCPLEKNPPKWYKN